MLAWPLALPYQLLEGTGLITGQCFAVLQTTLFTFSSCPQPHPVWSGEGRVVGTAAVDRWTKPLSALSPGILEMECTPQSLPWNVFSENMRLA